MSVIPIRRNADDRSEIVSQLLFGELCTIITKKHNSWSRINCEWDNYEGWIDSKQISFISEKRFKKLQSKRAYSIEVSDNVANDNGHYPILLASTLPLYDGISLAMANEKFRFSGQALQPSEIEYKPELLKKIALKYLRAPYLWGGRSPFGIDCSGLVQNVFKVFGVRLPRDAYKQAEEGQMVDFVAQAELGDLAFFHNQEGKITHVGILLEDGKIIHASGEVRIDTLDHFGIYNKDLKDYSHYLRYIKRIIH